MFFLQDAMKKGTAKAIPLFLGSAPEAKPPDS